MPVVGSGGTAFAFEAVGVAADKCNNDNVLRNNLIRDSIKISLKNIKL